MSHVTLLRWLRSGIAPLRGALDRADDAIAGVLHEQQEGPGLAPEAASDPSTGGILHLRRPRAAPHGVPQGLPGGPGDSDEPRRAAWEARVWTPPTPNGADDLESGGRPRPSMPRRRASDGEPRRSWDVANQSGSRHANPGQEPRTGAPPRPPERRSSGPSSTPAEPPRGRQRRLWDD